MQKERLERSKQMAEGRKNILTIQIPCTAFLPSYMFLATRQCADVLAYDISLLPASNLKCEISPFRTQ